jgi:hypothetical protein
LTITGVSIGQCVPKQLSESNQTRRQIIIATV